MAKAPKASPDLPKFKPQAHVSWPVEGVRISGDWKGLGPGKRCQVTVEGTVTGFQANDYGCSVDLDADTIRVEAAAGGGPKGTPMTDLISKARKG